MNILTSHSSENAQFLTDYIKNHVIASEVNYNANLTSFGENPDANVDKNLETNFHENLDTDLDKNPDANVDKNLNESLAENVDGSSSHTFL